MKKKLLFLCMGTLCMSTNVLFGQLQKIREQRERDKMEMAKMEEQLLAQQNVNIIADIQHEQARDVKDNNIHQNGNQQSIDMLNNLVKDFIKTKDKMPLSTVFRDYTRFEQELLESFGRVKEAVNLLSTNKGKQGELNGHSDLMENTLKSIFNTITIVRDHVEATIPQSKEWLNNPGAHARRLAQKDSFQKLSKKMIDECVKDMKSIQKKMKSKFGFFGGLLVGKPFLYKHAYEALKKIADTIDSMIKTFEDQALKKELYELMKK